MTAQRWLALPLACLLAGAICGFAADENSSALNEFFKLYDKNQDGFIDKSECPEAMKQFFDKLDASKDGKLSREELKKVEDKLSRFTGKGGNRPGETNTPPARGERPADKLKVGDSAPDFTLPDPTGKNQVKLSSFQGKKPVVLIFGSLT